MTNIKLAEREFTRSMAIMGVFSFATNCLLLIMPIYMLQIYDRVLPSRSSETLLFLSLIAMAGLIVLGLLEVVRTILANRTAARLGMRLSDDALRTIIRTGSMTGGNIQPMRDISTLRGLLSSKVVFALLDLPFAGLFIGIMYWIHPNLFWLTLSGALLVALIALANQYFSSRASGQQTEQTMRATRRAEHLARNADSVTAMGMLDNTVELWGRDYAASLAQADRAAGINAWFSGLSRTVRFALQIAILGYGALLVLEGQMTAGLIFAASIISARGLQPIDQIIGSWRQLVSGWGSWVRVRTFLQRARSEEKRISLPAPQGRIEVSGLLQPNPVDPARAPILRDVSFKLEPGEMLAVVGPSGAGKSTLARLLVGAGRARAGQVRIDGNDISNWNSEELGRHIGYLAQDVELIPGTIAENISRFEEVRNDEAIVEAARRAHAEQLILRMTRGFDTFIGPGGQRLSGGEKQRVALARAFYGSPRLLVLDEPNASLDKQGEDALRQALQEARGQGVTVIVVTQRDTLLVIADHVLRMQDGTVGEFSTRDDFLARHGIARAEPAASLAKSRFVAPMRAS
ncbi:MAG: type I secretion system permease/ATPase, partial [Pseudomonadota bacterium]|nr:type I secretion system permease/ATPase [Pseudomonadota bacterium]